MTQAIENARAMIALLGHSPWREVHVRTPQLELFLAKPGAVANPMRTRTAASPAATTIVRAPHVATFLSAIPLGSLVAVGEAVCRLDLLGETIDVVSGEAGTLAGVDVIAGELVEFGTPLVRLQDA